MSSYSLSDWQTDWQPAETLAEARVLDSREVQHCHITAPDLPRPTGAIAYGGQLYSYLRLFPTLEAAQRAAARSMGRGNQVLLTRVPKGFVLWILEPEARRLTKQKPF